MNQTSVSASITRVDLVGTCVSLICAVHCLTVPFLLTVLPLAGAGVLLGGSLGDPVHRGVRSTSDCRFMLGLPAAQAMACICRARRRTDDDRCRATPRQ